MRLEIWKDGQRKFYTDDPKAVPDKKVLAEMKKAGYKVKEVKE